MKGVIFRCLQEMVEKKYGRETWEKALEKAGLSKDMTVIPTQSVSDDVIINLIKSLCDVIGVSLPELADAFGDYWVNVYSQRIYKTFYDEASSAKDFLLKMDSVHRIMTKNIPDAHPPKFKYEWEDDRTLIMTYESHRNLIDLVVGLVKVVGKYYGENIKVSKLDDKRVKTVFDS